jgi:hypothetical protein
VWCKIGASANYLNGVSGKVRAVLCDDRFQYLVRRPK